MSDEFEDDDRPFEVDYPDYSTLPADHPLYRPNEPDDDGPPDDDYPCESWTNINIWTKGRVFGPSAPISPFDAGCWSDWATNDDNDDGVDDGDIASARYDHKTVWAALEFHSGGTRQGVLSDVTVRLEGDRIYTEWNPDHLADEPEYRPYCATDGKEGQ